MTGRNDIAREVLARESGDYETVTRPRERDIYISRET